MSRYSIILPVRNGGEYVKECVNSILRQTLPDFKLQVLDNCSTDGTREWIESLNDSRISIYPATRPLTIEENWSRIVTIPKNEFITLIGHDDILFPEYLQLMENLITKHPDASLYQTHFTYIDSDGKQIRQCKPMDEVQSAGEFLAFFLANLIDTMGTGFMMRSEDYDECGGIPARYPNLLFADFELFINLSGRGYKATSSEPAFSFRLHQSMTTTSSDLKFHDAFSVFIDYLHTLGKSNENFDTIIRRYVLDFLGLYCKGLSHRLLRTPMKKRKGKTVSYFIQLTKAYADKLVPGNDFQPEKQFSVKIAREIDNNPISRSLFLFFKKIRTKPVLQ
ncbi:MAG TPA: glycosyltransferase [Flavitalea sp.]|nr:glycosyltransferase [Flavitalea sp.]